MYININTIRTCVTHTHACIYLRGSICTHMYACIERDVVASAVKPSLMYDAGPEVSDCQLQHDPDSEPWL